MLCIFFLPFFSSFIDRLFLAQNLMVGFLECFFQNFKRKHFVSMRLASRKVFSLLSTFLENYLVMQINSGVKQHKGKISFACILASEVKRHIYLIWSLSSPLTKSSEKMYWQKQKLPAVFITCVHPQTVRTIWYLVLKPLNYIEIIQSLPK